MAVMPHNSDSNNARICLIVSIAFHALLALLLAFVVLKPQEEVASEFMAIQMVSAPRQTKPPRKLQLRDSIIGIRKHGAPKAKALPVPHRANADVKSYSRAEMAISEDQTSIPDLVTNVANLKLRFQMPRTVASGATV